MNAPTESLLQVAFFTPWRARCGIADYSRHLIESLQNLPEIGAVRIVEAPAESVRTGTGNALRHFAGDARRFRELGAAMNQSEAGQPSNVAHVQHQYFFFGGVAPHKNHARAFLDAVRVPIVMTVHEIAEESGSRWKRAAIEAVNRANFLSPRLRGWIVHTEGDAAKLRELGADAERIHRIPVGVPPALPMPTPDEAKEELGLTGRRVLTLFGFLSAKKGHRTALEAMSGLPDDVVLLFAGDQHPDDHTEYVPELRADMVRRGLTERVRITGYVPDAQVPVLMAATDIALAPFGKTSGSASLAHLLAYARPIVASNISAFAEIARESPACLKLYDVSGQESEALSATLRELLADGEARNRLQEAARAYADRHSFANVARATCAVYRQALSE